MNKTDLEMTPDEADIARSVAILAQFGLKPPSNGGVLISVAAYSGTTDGTRWQAAKLFRALEIPLEPPLGLPEKSERLDGAPERLSPVELALFTQKAPPLIAAAMREHHISWCRANGYEPYIQEGA